MSEKVEIPAILPKELEAEIQRIARHSGYTRDEVIEKCVAAILEMADEPSERIERPAFIFTVKKALDDAGPQS